MQYALSMNRSEVEEFLQSTIEDGRLSRAEKTVLRSIVATQAVASHERDWIRSRAFQIAQAFTRTNPSSPFDWLEDVAGILVTAERPSPANTRLPVAEALFSPGDQCRNRICDLLREAVESVDICVFTITDNIISDSIIDTHARGVNVRVISDNDKAQDKGSDLQRMKRMGVGVAFDHTADHMHHKFAVFDGRVLVSGSYNWTRSAADRNEENIIVTDDRRLVERFAGKFESLWRSFT